MRPRTRRQRHRRGRSSEWRFVRVDGPHIGGRVGGRVGETATVSVGEPLGSGGSDEVTNLLDTAADGGDQDLQRGGVGERAAEFGVTPIRAKTLVIDLGGVPVVG